MKHILISVFTLLVFSLIALSLGCHQNPYPQGKNLYTFYCANCHMDDGSGLKKLIPSLTSEGHLASIKGKLPCIIKYGVSGPIQVDGIEFNQAMEGFRHLSNAEINNIINYMLALWAPNEAPLSPPTIKTLLEKCQEQ